MSYGIIVACILVAQVAMQPTIDLPGPIREALARETPQGRLRVLVQRIRAAPPDPSQPPFATTSPDENGIQWIPNSSTFAFRLTTTLEPKGEVGHTLWSRDLANDLLNSNTLRILDAALFDRTVVVLFLSGGMLEAEVATPDVAGSTLLSSYAPPTDDRGYRLPTMSCLVHRTDIALNPGTVRGHISGSPAAGNLTVTVTGDRSTRTFVLVPDGQRFRWKERED